MQVSRRTAAFRRSTWPAGFTASGFPVGVELLGRAFAESTLLVVAYSFEQATHHRRLPQTTPADLRAPVAVPTASADTGLGSVTGMLNATGANAVLGNQAGAAGTYLHRPMTDGARGGIAHVLTKSSGGRLVGLVQ